LNLAFGFLVPQIDNFAHIGGLLGGLILGYCLDVTRARKPSLALQILAVVGVAAAGVALAAYRTSTFF